MHPDTLENRTIQPYSDFLLHDVGTGDGIPIALVEHLGASESRSGCANWKHRAPQKQSSAQEERPRTNVARAKRLRCSSAQQAQNCAPLGTSIALAPDARWCIGPTQ